MKKKKTKSPGKLTDVELKELSDYTIRGFELNFEW